MKRTIIAVSLLFAACVSTGCNKGEDKMLPDGTKLFGERTLKDGIRKAVRVERPDGKKQFDVTWLPDGTVKSVRDEFPSGEKAFDVTWLPDGTVKVGHEEFATGEKQFDSTELPDGTRKIGHSEFRNGEKAFDTIKLADGTQKIGRWEFPNGLKDFNLTRFPDGTTKIGRVEFPNGEKRLDVTLLPDGAEKVDLGFRGLHAGQSREVVEAVLKQQDATLSLHCEKPNPNGSVSCDPDSISFSRDGKLVHFQIYASSHSGEDSESFFSSLRRELAAANHKEGEAEPPGEDALSRLTANMGIRSFTWDTPQKAVCLWDQEKECPAQQIRLTEHHQCSSYDGRCMAFVDFTDNAYLTEGWVKKDKNRPQPKVAGDIVFIGLDGGEPRSQVDVALHKQGYEPLSCKYDPKELEHNCKTSSGSHRFDLTFVHDQLSSFRFYYPEKEHDALYQNLVTSLGQPTDFSGKPGEGVYSWMTERTVPCGDADADKQCTADLLMLSSEDVTYNDALLFNMQVREKTQRILNASHDH